MELYKTLELEGDLLRLSKGIDECYERKEVGVGAGLNIKRNSILCESW